jgi:hypothetical protein
MAMRVAREGGGGGEVAMAFLVVVAIGDVCG